MDFRNWVAFVNNFTTSIAQVMPVDSFFSYEMASPSFAHSYYYQNLPKTTVDSYLNKDYLHDPLFFGRHYAHKDNMVVLSQQPITAEYQEFLNESQLVDNVELFFKINQVPVKGLSLIRVNQKPFSVQELQLLQSFYSLANYHFSQTFESPQKSLCQRIVQEFTKKEQQVIELIMQGKKNQSIADELFVSLPTIKTHIQHIFQKMHVGSKQELISKIMHLS